MAGRARGCEGVCVGRFASGKPGVGATAPSGGLKRMGFGQGSTPLGNGDISFERGRHSSELIGSRKGALREQSP